MKAIYTITIKEQYMNDQSLIVKVARSSKTQLENRLTMLNRQIVKRKETFFDSLITVLIFLGFKSIKAYITRKFQLPSPKKG